MHMCHTDAVYNESHCAFGITKGTFKTSRFPLLNMRCAGGCGGGAGLQPEVLFIYEESKNGGTSCPGSNMTTTRNTSACINNQACPTDCEGSWQDEGSCNGGQLVMYNIAAVASSRCCQA